MSASLQFVLWILLAAIFTAFIAVASSIYRRSKPLRRSINLPLAREIEAVPLPQDTPAETPRPGDAVPDIDASSAFFQILKSSEWSRIQDRVKDTRNLIYDWREVQLSRAIHNALRNSRLTAWGEECLQGTSTTPEKPIPPETWDRSEIKFEPLSMLRTAAYLKGRTRRDQGQMTWIGVKFFNTQIFQVFPLLPKPSVDRISMVELLAIAHDLGWDFTSHNSLQLIDLQDAIRQGGLDGHLTVWGRRNRWPRAKSLMLNEVIEKVPPQHWTEFRVNLFPAMDGDNFGTTSWHVSPSSATELAYVDLHVERAEAAEWLKADASSFKGKRTAENRT